jgi:hypothetical protein
LFASECGGTPTPFRNTGSGGNGFCTPLRSGTPAFVTKLPLERFHEGFPLDFRNDAHRKEHNKKTEKQGHHIAESTHPFGNSSGFVFFA